LQSRKGLLACPLSDCLLILIEQVVYAACEINPGAEKVLSILGHRDFNHAAPQLHAIGFEAAQD
jgi:hypothetical protein